jgi:hypothetical protein
MELDKTILEKICYDEHNSGMEHGVPVTLEHYDVIIDNDLNSNNWIVKCVYSVPMNVNGVVKEGWSYNATQFVNKLQYEKEKTRLIREKKLNELGI